MNTRIGNRRVRIVRASAGIVAAVGVALSFSACATAAQTQGGGVSAGAWAERPAYLSHLAPADRLEEAILREAERRQALAQEFAGLPADRIEQRMAAATGRQPRTVKECAVLALAQRPVVTADTSERLAAGLCG
ncbi:hypothetical protein [Agromyces sp. SYSU T00266]|uniref:hypothetical protein n=1 Tax=Agromyces zhanjiangensis TaxID=3158562 RepID=UPI003395A227